MKLPSVLIADDHIIVSQGLQSLLEDEFDVVGTVTNGRALIDAARQLKPDVLVVDISMPILNGLDAVRELRREGDDTKVVFLTMHAEAQIAIEAIRIGATGYVLKQAAGDELVAAIRASMKGRTYLTPFVGQDVLQLLIGSRHRQEQQLAQRATHKYEVLEMLAQGRTHEDIAEAMSLDREAVEAYRDEMIQTFGVQTTSQLIRLASQMGLVSVSPVDLDHSSTNWVVVELSSTEK
jgi:DNA-binding NarL/FixJ family response regulator